MKKVQQITKMEKSFYSFVEILEFLRKKILNIKYEKFPPKFFSKLKNRSIIIIIIAFSSLILFVFCS